MRLARTVIAVLAAILGAGGLATIGYPWLRGMEIGRAISWGRTVVVVEMEGNVLGVEVVRFEDAQWVPIFKKEGVVWIYAEPPFGCWVYSRMPIFESRKIVPAKCVYLVVPVWAVMAVSVALFALSVMVLAAGPLRRRRRRGSGLCEECGYDLRGNRSGVCPECGRCVAPPWSRRMHPPHAFLAVAVAA